MFKKRSSSQAAIVGLDLDPGHIAAAEVTANGSVSLKRGAVAPLRHGILRDGEVADVPALSDALKTFFAENELEGNVLQAYRGPDWKLIQANAGNPRGLPERQLFDVTRDPREQHDLASSRPEELATLAACRRCGDPTTGRFCAFCRARAQILGEHLEESVEEPDVAIVGNLSNEVMPVELYEGAGR